MNNNFNIGTFNADHSAVNLGGTVAGDQNVTQHNYAAPNPQLESALQDLKNTLAELQQQHPNIATETEAIEIIDGELTNPFPSPTASKLVLLRQQFLNPERHFQAAKATLAEVAKHYLEESVFAKAFITYIDTLSSNPEEGA
jgi:hypothetical protein